MPHDNDNETELTVYEVLMNDLINGNLTEYKEGLNKLTLRELTQFILYAGDLYCTNNINNLCSKLKLERYLLN